MCNPYYSAYIGGALAANAEPVFLNATQATGHLPDLDALAADKALLERTVALYLCSPANPQGAVASPRIHRPRTRTRARNTTSCCSSTSAIRSSTPRRRPPARCRSRPRRPSASPISSSSTRCRSARTCRACARASAPAMRRFIETFAEIRNMVAPQVPGADAARLRRRLGGRGARRGQPRSLPAQIRGLRPRPRQPIRLPPAGRRLLPLARCEQLWRRRSGNSNLMATRRCQGSPRCLPGSSRTRWDQSGGELPAPGFGP